MELMSGFVELQVEKETKLHQLLNNNNSGIHLCVFSIQFQYIFGFNIDVNLNYINYANHLNHTRLNIHC